MNYVTDKRVMAYLSSFPKRQKKDLKTVFPAAGDDALDLLSKTIKFSVQNRITLEEAMKHPFFDKVRTLPDVQEANSLTSPTMLKKTAG
jgi:serine/threonine protein kinase